MTFGDSTLADKNSNSNAAAGRLSMKNILAVDHFVNNSIDNKQDRLNTILNETFQMTVRQKIIEDSGLEIQNTPIALLNSTTAAK